MYPLTVKHVCEVVDGTICGNIKLAAILDGCVIDSRQVQRGDVFVALPGSQTHGVEYSAAALRDGADVVIVDESAAHMCHTPHIKVADAQVALAQLGWHNRQASDALVIAVTGSVGKTTARRMIAATLESVHTGIQSPRNFNNHLGVPLSLLELQSGDEFAVIEVGSSAPGEVEMLASVVRPEFSVVTSVSPAHLDGLKSLQAVQQEKQALVTSLSRDGIAFLNVDDPLVAEMATSAPGRVVTFGTAETAEVRATAVDMTDNALVVTVDGDQYTVRVCGRHNVTNVLAAIAVGLEVGLAPEQINAGLSTYEPEPGRCCPLQIGSWTVIDDTYNSSPASVTAAVRTAEEFRHCRHRVLVLNDMMGLGEQSADQHYGMGAALASSKLDHIALMGDFAGDVVEGFLACGGALNRISCFANPALLATMLDCLLCDNDLVLVKGSRATRMEQVVESLRRLACTDVADRRAA
ncbi:MAG: UDP-N-acetylmuramoyl-tripeptide--D-alanyl-D-alanine ligase [Fuerstiella sp.]|nr:UDP-N-acetylmuramoyl-tripeptide--D-alanyl-D-alanine ligase [Fuerstiella sp.]MCP4784615.1 UDP-N-acetylmuramoyl-tripeptide--D-alanyl-D-alanine ligase [Fuerstiella sp.]MCP4854935.1 UDP-N-acetylmuramoyl-tripeptide--D-alanyl-D-alanine ligase [Fuerstiella sp.]